MFRHNSLVSPVCLLADLRDEINHSVVLKQCAEFEIV